MYLLINHTYTFSAETNFLYMALPFMNFKLKFLPLAVMLYSLFIFCFCTRCHKLTIQLAFNVPLEN